MQSLRQTCVLILPLLCFEGLHILRCLWKKQPVYPRARRMRLWRCLACAGANALGLLVIRLLPVRRHEIYTGASVFSGASLAAKLRDLHAALVTVTGYDATREGDGRFFFILMFLGSTLLVLAALFLLLRGKRQADGAGCFWLVAVLGCAAVIAASFVTAVQLRPIYLFLYYALPALSFAVIAEKGDAPAPPAAGACMRPCRARTSSSATGRIWSAALLPDAHPRAGDRATGRSGTGMTGLRRAVPRRPRCGRRLRRGADRGLLAGRLHLQALPLYQHPQHLLLYDIGARSSSSLRTRSCPGMRTETEGPRTRR